VSLSAVIADQVPQPQRGRASAAMGVSQVIALAGGMVLVTELITDVSHSWLAVAVLALLTPLPFLFGFAEPPAPARRPRTHQGRLRLRDRKSTRLNSSHVSISYAVFCLK